MAGAFTGDSRNPDRGPGIVPAQDFSWKGRGVPLRNRGGRLAVRIAGRQVQEGDIGGKWVYADRSLGDVTGLFLWGNQGRELPTWREAMPAVRVGDEGEGGGVEFPSFGVGQGEYVTTPFGGVEADSREPTHDTTGATTGLPGGTGPGGGTGGGGGSDTGGSGGGGILNPEPVESVSEAKLKEEVRPTFSRDVQPNDGYMPVEVAYPRAPKDDGKSKGPPPWPEFPIGFHGLVVSSSDDLEQIEYWHPTDPRLIAVNKAGNVGCGTLIADLDDKSAIDTERMAPIHAALRVVKKPTGDFSLKDNKVNALALQIGRSGKKDVLALIADGTGSLARATARDGGPFDVGDDDDKHSLGEDADGTKINPLHFSARAFYRDDKKHDGPLEFTDIPYPKTLAGSFYVPVMLSFDAGFVYRWPYGGDPKRRDEGMWRWWAPVFLGAIGDDDEPPRGPGSPPGDTTPPRGPGTPGGDTSGGPTTGGGDGGGGGGAGSPGGDTGGGPGTGGPTNNAPIPGGPVTPGGGYGGGYFYPGLTGEWWNRPKTGGDGGGDPGPPGGDTDGGPTTPGPGEGGMPRQESNEEGR